MDKILIDTGPSEWGWHRLETILRCPFLYAFKYKLGGDDEAGPLVRGTLGHIGLAHYYARLGSQQHGQDPERFYTPHDAIALKCDREGGRYNEFREQMQQLVQSYAANYIGERMKVKAIEVPVKMEIGGEVITQRFDLVMESPDGRYYVWDHKITSKIDKRTSARYDLSGQFLEMVYQGRKLYGDRFGGVRVNILQADGSKFIRVSPEPAMFALQKFPDTVRYAEQQIERFKDLDPHDYPRVFSEMTCMTQYGPCPARDLCMDGPAVIHRK